MTVTDFALYDAAYIERRTNVGDPLDVLYLGNNTPPSGVPSTEDGTATVMPDEIDYYLARRALLRFDTSALSGKVITKVELYRNFAAGQPNGASRYDFRYSIGEFGTDPFTYNATLFNGGTDCYTEEGASFTDPETLDLGATGVSAISTTGLTTIKIRNAYNEIRDPDSPYVAGSCIWEYQAGSDPCYLRVTWENPVTPHANIAQLMFGE